MKSSAYYSVAILFPIQIGVGIGIWIRVDKSTIYGKKIKIFSFQLGPPKYTIPKRGDSKVIAVLELGTETPITSHGKTETEAKELAAAEALMKTKYRFTHLPPILNSK